MDSTKRSMACRGLISLLFLMYWASCDGGPSKNDEDIAYAEGNQKLLQRFLNSSHYPRIMPLTRNKTVIVEFGFKLINIVEVNARKQFIKVYGWVIQKWRNMFLTWNPEDYDGLDTISVDSTAVWVPDILLYNNLDDEDHYAGGSFTYKTNVMITSDGWNTWYNPALFKTFCKIQVKYFPLDNQNCFLKFGSWTQSSTRLQLVPMDVEFPSDYYKQNEEWSIYDMSLCNVTRAYTSGPYDHVILKIYMSRQSFDYVIKLIIPCCLISSMIFLGFVLPPESGERVGLSITVLLAMTVFQQLTSEIMPSYGFPILGQYYFAIVLEIATSIVVTTLILNFYNRTHRKMPFVLRKLILHWMSRLIFLHDEVARKYGASNNSTNTCATNSELHYNKSANESRQKSVRRSTRRNKRDVSPGAETADHYDAFADMGDIFKEQNPDNDAASQNVYGMNVYPKINYATCMNGDTNRDTNIVLEQNEDQDISEEEREMRKWEWTLAARILDRFVLVLSVLIGVCTVGGVFLRAPSLWVTHKQLKPESPKNITDYHCDE